MARVFVVQDNPRIDVTPAQKFGEIKCLFRAHDQVYHETTEAVTRVHDQLKNIEEDDYLVMSGDPCLMVVVACVAADLLDGKLNLLKWDRREHQYVAVRFSDVFNRSGVAEHR